MDSLQRRCIPYKPPTVVEDTVLDPFCGSGTSLVAALKSQRNSIGFEIDPEYCRTAARYLKAESQDLFSRAELKFENLIRMEKGICVREDEGLYQVRPAKKKLEEIEQPGPAADANQAALDCG